jgi:hypothetical protein
LPLLFLPSPSPYLLPTTLVTFAIAIAALTIALFVARNLIAVAITCITAVAITCVVAVAITIVAVACLPPSLP